MRLDFLVTKGPLVPSNSMICPRNGSKRRQKAPKTAQCAPAPRSQERAVSWATWLKTEFRGHLVHPQPPTFYGFQASEYPNETRRSPYQWSLGAAGGPASPRTVGAKGGSTRPDGQSVPWLQVYANHPAVGNVMGWPREVLPVLQQPLCSLPVLAVAVVLDVGTLWLYDRQLRRAVPAVAEQRSMAVLVGSKQLARVQGDDAQGHVTEAMFSLPEGDDHVAADARHTLDTLGLEAVIEARAGGQRLVLASARGPEQDGVDVIGEVLGDYGWELLAHGTRSPMVARWPRLLESLPEMPDGRPILRPVSTWEEARRSLPSSATARTLTRALLGLQDACCDVWQDLWSQCCDGSCVPSRSVLPQRCHGCGETVSVWVHQCASAPLCGTCKEHADRGWPKARWALRHSGRMSSSAWATIQGGLKSVRVEGVWCPGAPSAALPLMLWWAALEGDSRILWLWHRGGNGDGVVGAGGAG